VSKKAVLRTAQDIFALDNAFFLIDGMTKGTTALRLRVEVLATWLRMLFIPFAACHRQVRLLLMNNSGASG
jgi:hypothetical protein